MGFFVGNPILVSKILKSGRLASFKGPEGAFLLFYAIFWLF